MFTRKSTIVLLSATLFASVTLAADVAEPETPGSAGPKAVAEAVHMARDHGVSRLAPQPIAQAPGNEAAQAVSEAIHLKRQHGATGETADQRMLREASRL